MMIRFYSNQRIGVAACVLFLLVSLIMGRVICRGMEQGNGEPLRVYVTPSEGDQSVWYVRVSRPLAEVAGGGSAAVLFSLEASAGWRITRMEKADGAEGMVLTVGDTLNTRRVSVLLDGMPPVQDGELDRQCLLRVTVEQDDEWHEGNVCTLQVRGGKHGGEVLYMADGEGGVCTYPLIFESYTAFEESEVPEADSDSTEMTAETEGFIHVTEETDRVFKPDGTEALSETEKPTKPETESDQASENIFAGFAGCQETPVRDGEYAVRFLFYGKGNTSPVVCTRGGGMLALTAERTGVIAYLGKDGMEYLYAEAGMHWSVCTFSGLRGDRRYEFTVWTDRGEVIAVYDGGRFVEFISNNPVKCTKIQD